MSDTDIRHELELKFAVGGAFAVPDLAGVGSVAEMLPLSTQELRATYYDTVDRRLARSGITLRHRIGEGDHAVWTLKLPFPSTDLHGVPMADRAEVEADGQPDTIPPSLAELVTAHARSHPLMPAAVLTTRRGRWQLLAADGRAVAELVNDEVSVLDGEEVRVRFIELELEARGATIRDLEAMTGRLLEAGAVGAEPIPKAVRALGPSAAGPPDVVVPAVAPDDPAGWALRAALADGLQRILRHDPGTRLGSVESLHQFRVAVRRLRSDLRTFRPLLGPAWAPGLDAELRELGARLGAVRDLDVLLERMETAHADLAAPLAPMLDDLHRRRNEARDRLMAGLRSDRYTQLLERLVVLARDPERIPAGSETAGTALPALAAGAWTRLERVAEPIVASTEPSDEKLHAMRIRAKRARYAAEAAARGLPPDLADEAQRFADGLGALQDLLGRHQDAVVATQQARAAAVAHPDDVELAMAAGQVTERERHAARRERRRLGRTWSMLRRRRHRRWMER